MRLYLHIPFCLRKCPYCDFVSFPADGALMDAYLQAILREMRLTHAQEGGGGLESVYFGGGTPSLYRPGELGRLLEEAVSLWGLEKGAEVTVEVNPVTWGENDLREARKAGFNRLSIGAQSFNRRDLEVLGRVHGPREALKAAHAALSLEGISVGLDLIFGIPGQRKADWRSNLDTALRLRPHHLSLYLLSPGPGTPLMDWIEKGSLSLPGEEEAVEMYETACLKTAEHGYCHYEISNFALPGQACRHNLAYWKREGYLGLGVAAHSLCPPNRRWSNPVDLEVYLASLEEGRLPPRCEEILTPEEIWEEQVMLALRTMEGLRRSQIQKGWAGRELQGWLENLCEEGLAWMSEDAFGLTEQGMFVSNTVLAKLLTG